MRHSESFNLFPEETRKVLTFIRRNRYCDLISGVYVVCGKLVLTFIRRNRYCDLIPEPSLDGISVLTFIRRNRYCDLLELGGLPVSATLS